MWNGFQESKVQLKLLERITEKFNTKNSTLTCASVTFTFTIHD